MKVDTGSWWRARGLPACLAVAVLTGPARPASAANREHQQMMAEIRMLQEQNQQLAVSLAALAKVLETLGQRMDEQAAADRKALADQRVVIDTVGGEVRVVREKLDDNNVRLSRLSQELEALRAAIPPPGTVMAAADPSAAGAAPGEPGAPGAAAPGPAAPSTAGLSPQRLYDTAYADFASGQWAMAITGFEMFIKSFPRSEQADQAQYYIAESYLIDGKFDQAVTNYDKVIANYPTGDQVPLAFYKRGIALLQLKQTDRARESWETCIAKYPDSDASRLAKQGLDRLSRGR
jgi:tol-pal system protein YbgF